MENRNSHLSGNIEIIAHQIVNAAFHAHSSLGHGLLEKVYETCMLHELTKSGLSVQRQVIVPIKYDELYFDEGLRLDLLVEDSIICELKAAENNHPVWKAQLLSYLKLTGKRLGFIINFHVPLIKDGILE